MLSVEEQKKQQKVFQFKLRRQDRTREAFRHRRKHNAETEARLGITADEKQLLRDPLTEFPAKLPRSAGLVKDWRYYRRVGAVWSDYYSTPIDRIQRTGVITKEIIELDIKGLEHICSKVAEEQREAKAADDSRLRVAKELRAKFNLQVAANRASRQTPEEAADEPMVMTRRHTPQQSRTQMLAKHTQTLASRRELFNRVGCSDMRGLLITDRALTSHLGKLCDEYEITLPDYEFMPPRPSSAQQRPASAQQTRTWDPAPSSRLAPISLDDDLFGDRTLVASLSRIPIDTRRSRTSI